MLNAHTIDSVFFENEITPGSNPESLHTFSPLESLKKTVNFHHYLQEKFFTHSGLMDDLQDYLEQDDLNICYQPIVETRTNKTVCAEALIRWQHKLAGFISPEIFIPMAEKSGHIHALTYWILNHTLEQMHIWEKENLAIDLAINVSMFNLHEKSFAREVSRLLEKWSITPSKVILEITEGVIMYNPERAIKILSELEETGVRLALDDFGTGYSSLSHLARLPINELKIDRSLITDIDKNRKNAMIVKSTIDLAKNLGLKVVAEGVENGNVLEILGNFVCDTVQGYHFSKPLCQQDFKSWLYQSND